MALTGNIAITTRLVDTATIPMLFRTVAAKKIDPGLLIIHRFKPADIHEAMQPLAMPPGPGP